MVKLEDLKKGDKFYIFDRKICYAQTIIECEVEHKYLKSVKYLLANTMNHIYPNKVKPVTFEGGIPFSNKIYKNLEKDMFSIDKIEEAIDYRDQEVKYYEIGMMADNNHLFEDWYELGRDIEDSNDRACENHECEDCYCGNDDCKFWNVEDHNGQSKSDYDENKAFINNLDPNDPADEWFFED